MARSLLLLLLASIVAWPCSSVDRRDAVLLRGPADEAPSPPADEAPAPAAAPPAGGKAKAPSPAAAKSPAEAHVDEYVAAEHKERHLAKTQALLNRLKGLMVDGAPGAEEVLEGRDEEPTDSKGRVWCDRCATGGKDSKDAGEPTADGDQFVKCIGSDGYCESRGARGRGRSWCRVSGFGTGNLGDLAISGFADKGKEATKCYFCAEAGDTGSAQRCGKCLEKMQAPQQCSQCGPKSCLTADKRCKPRGKDGRCGGHAGGGGGSSDDDDEKGGGGDGGERGGGGGEGGGKDISDGEERMWCGHCPASGAAKCDGADGFCESEGKDGQGQTWCKQSGKGSGPFNTQDINGYSDQKKESAQRCYFCRQGSAADACLRCKDKMTAPNQCEVCNDGSCTDSKGRCVPRSLGRCASDKSGSRR